MPVGWRAQNQEPKQTKLGGCLVFWFVFGFLHLGFLHRLRSGPIELSLVHHRQFKRVFRKEPITCAEWSCGRRPSETWVFEPGGITSWRSTHGLIGAERSVWVLSGISPWPVVFLYCVFQNKTTVALRCFQADLSMSSNFYMWSKPFPCQCRSSFHLLSRSEGLKTHFRNLGSTHWAPVILLVDWNFDWYPLNLSKQVVRLHVKAANLCLLFFWILLTKSTSCKLAMRVVRDQVST